MKGGRLEGKGEGWERRGERAGKGKGREEEREGVRAEEGKGGRPVLFGPVD